MTIGNPHDLPPDQANSARSKDTVVSLHDAASALRRTGRRERSDDRRTAADYEVADRPSELGASRRNHGTDPKAHGATVPSVASEDTADDGTGAPSVPDIVVLTIPSSPTASARERGGIVRRRLNAAARPILRAYARSHGPLSKSLQMAIEGPAPLAHPAIARELGGALHSEAMRNAIAANAESGLVPLKVRTGLAKLLAQNLADPPPSAAVEAFPDWDKPLVPTGQHHPAWHARGAAAWLKHFPPTRHLPHPLDTWDDATAAPWLNDRESIVSASENGYGDGDRVVVAIDAANPWKPSLEVLHTLGELELEEIAFRVFVERLRREVMPFYVSERRICVRDAILHVTFGYRTLKDARRRVRDHDLKRIRHFDRVFGTEREWIYDLCCRIVAAYAWPVGFAESELSSEFPDLSEA